MPNQTFETWVAPAIRSIYESDGLYRCERDLHHHLTSLFERTAPLNLGSLRAVAEYEHPTLGKYCWTGQSDTSGNVDIHFFRTDSEGEQVGDVAIEVNYNYPSTEKSKQDLIKLIDPLNAYACSVYIACGVTCGFKDSVVVGLTKAFDWFNEDDPGFLLPAGLVLFVIEDCRGKRTLWTGKVEAPCHLSTLVWSSESRDRVEPRLLSATTASDAMDLLSKEEAARILSDAMRAAGIPSTSKTARCMFETTLDSQGQNNCKHGRTPLWEHEIARVGDKVIRAELMGWVQRLCESGKKRQDARRSSWLAKEFPTS